MIHYAGLSHINIVVDNMEEASRFYRNTLHAQPAIEFPHFFRNRGFARSAGFLQEPCAVDVSIRFLILPTEDKLTLELMEYHSPRGSQAVAFKHTNDLGGPRHIALNVRNFDEAFEHVKSQPGVRLINESPEYKPFQIDPINNDEFSFFDDTLNENPEARQNIKDMIGQIRYFYFIDPYGVQWEFEQKPE